jgi:hypothetical protein
LGDSADIGAHSEEGEQRRGFSYSIARETVRALWEETRGTSPDAEDDIADDNA